MKQEIMTTYHLDKDDWVSTCLHKDGTISIICGTWTGFTLYLHPVVARMLVDKVGDALAEHINQEFEKAGKQDAIVNGMQEMQEQAQGVTV